MISKTFRLTLSLIALLTFWGWAQEVGGGANPPTLSGGSLVPLDSEKHVLRPGDRIEFHLSALPDLPKEYTIRVDGRFYHSLVGDIDASGRTLGELRDELRGRLARELRNPEFRIGILSVTMQQVAVLGEANRQGTFQVGNGATILDLIAAAGGLSEKADREKAMLLRGEEKLEVSLRPDAAEGLIRVRSGDVLYILRGSPVSVTGEVTAPGVYSVSRVSGTPFQAIMAAGGAKEEASLGRVRLIRATEPKPIVLDLRPNAETGLPVAAQQLAEGDILVVPARQAVVLGAVTKPGPVPLRGNETLIDLLPAMVHENSDIDRIMVVRSEDVQATRDKKEEYNLREYFEDGKADVVVPIGDGDLVYVPAKSKGGGLFDNMGILGILSIAQFLF